MSDFESRDGTRTARPTRLGPYELVSPIGRGGMGEVYRARDSRLNRTVAIKILAGDLARNTEARRRFQREAQVIAALNHPNVCAVHDVGRVDDVDFLVMEYVEGESLADRLKRGPMPLDEMLARSSEILDALAHAHAAGVVHRDIKPSNIMLTKSGAKLLDFGIAGLHRGMSTAETEADTGGTTPGRIFGTLRYMAPEQLESKPTDARTDVFACGLVLYEMATGHSAVVGDGTTAIITAILTGPPASIREVLPEFPSDVDWAITRALAREPAERWQSALDFSAVLRWSRRRPATSAATPTAGESRPHSKRASIALALVTLAAITGAVFAWRWRGTEAPSDATVRATIPLVGGGVLGTDGQPAIALSADGTRLVYVASVNSRTSLYFRRLDQLDSVLLPGTDGASAPFFAADGNSVGFFADRKLKRVSFDGAHAIIICDAPRGRGGAWETNDTIVFAPTSDGPLFRVSATGGRPEPITSLDQSPRERSHRWPELLPGGRTVLYTSGNPTDTTLSDSRIVVESVGDPSSRRVLVENSSYARYSAGHLLYVMGSALMAVRFDPAGAKITGSPFTVVNAVSNSRYVGSAQMSASRDGTLIYVSPGGGGYMTTAWVTRQGVPSPLAGVEGLLTSVRLSPDERRIAFNSAEGDADIHVYDIARQSLERITFGPEFEGNPVWTPDGTRIVYASDRGPAVQMYWKRWDDPRGSPGALAQRPAEDEALAPGDYARIPHVWSPDGNLLAFTENHPESRRDIWLMQKGPGAKAVPFVASPFEDNYPAFSPDGRWLAYQSNDSGGDEIYARRLEGDSPRVQLTPAGGAGPRWAANGDLFYWSAGRMFAVPVSTQDDTLRVGAHQQLFPVASLPFFDVTADGQRLIMLRLDDPPPAHQLIVVHNWVSPARSR